LPVVHELRIASEALVGDRFRHTEKHAARVGDHGAIQELDRADGVDRSAPLARNLTPDPKRLIVARIPP